MFLINEFGEYLLNSRGHAFMFLINEFGEYLLNSRGARTYVSNK